MKKVIINADDLGYSSTVNEGIKQGFQSGLITSTSLIVNLEGFDDAINVVLPQIKEIDLGIHLNIIEGKCLSKNKLLCDNNELFNNSFLKLILKSENKEFQKAIEEEFRLQIEKALMFGKISHIDSHVHTHAIPNIFKITQTLANEYGIKYIRTQRELPYLVKEKLLDKRFPINVIKNTLLNYYTYLNVKNKANTNDYFIGVLYTGYMDDNSIIEGLRRIKKENSITEVIFHPACATNNNEQLDKNRYSEFLITQNKTLKDRIKNLGFEISCFSMI